MPETPTGNRYILNILDHATKYAESYASPTANAKDVEKALSDVIARHGHPKTLLTDRGTAFISDSTSTFLADNGIRHLTSSIGHPESNGAVEKFNGSQKSMLKILSENSSAP